jgi:hypothetical protein
MSWFRYRGTHKPASTQWDGSAQPSVSPTHQRLESLFAWERRCRGYTLFSEPVALEPTFAPFDADERAVDWDALPQAQFAPESLCSLRLTLPVEQAVTVGQLSSTWSALSGLRSPISLEIIADGQAIQYQIVCANAEAQTVQTALAMAFPQASLSVGEDALRESLSPLFEDANRHLDCRIVDFGLSESALRPLRLVENLSRDPHVPLLGLLGSLEEGEVAGLQLLVQPITSPWSAALQDWLEQMENIEGLEQSAAHPGTRDSERGRALRYKLGSPLVAASFRLFAVVGSVSRNREARALSICQQAAQALSFTGERSSNGVLGNELLALDDTGYEPSDQFGDLLGRRRRRPGMLLSHGELTGLWHPPSPSLVHPRLLRHDPHRRDLPEYLQEAIGASLGLLAGLNGTDQIAKPGADSNVAEPQLVPWPDAFRNRHFYMLGATRMGKSTLLHNLIVQDLWAGRGLCLIDPHGDLAQDVLATIPPEREKDVLFLDLSDSAFPPALGLLQAGSEWEKRLLVSDLLSILHRVFASSWGDRLEHILRHALLTLLADDGPDAPVHTLRDIRSLLGDEAYREDLLGRLLDPDLQSFWRSEFRGYSSTAFAPIYNKLGLLLSSPVVRNIVAGRESKLDPGALIRERRVVIANLASSLIGQDNAHFLGALLVSKIQLAAMHGLRLGQAERVPFTLYVDEFQNFVVSSFESILSEAGKAGLSLVMANQFLEQLGEGLQSAILSNVGTLVSFRVSAPSGRRLEAEFGGHFGAKDLTDLERGQAVVRLGKAGDSFALRTFAPVTSEDVQASPDAPRRIIAATQREVCRPRHDVESELRSDETLLQQLREAWEAEQDRKKREGKAKPEDTAKPEVKTKPEGKVKPVAGDKELDSAQPKLRAKVARRTADAPKDFGNDLRENETAESQARPSKQAASIKADGTAKVAKQKSTGRALSDKEAKVKESAVKEPTAKAPTSKEPGLEDLGLRESAVRKTPGCKKKGGKEEPKSPNASHDRPSVVSDEPKASSDDSSSTTDLSIESQPSSGDSQNATSRLPQMQDMVKTAVFESVSVEVTPTELSSGAPKVEDPKAASSEVSSAQPSDLLGATMREEGMPRDGKHHATGTQPTSPESDTPLFFGLPDAAISPTSHLDPEPGQPLAAGTGQDYGFSDGKQEGLSVDGKQEEEASA